MRAVNHAPIVIVADDWGAPKSLEDPDLDLLRPECDQAVEAGGETFHIFSRKPDDQVGVDVDAGLFAEEAEVVCQPVIILPAADAVGDVGIKGLDANLELECAGRELGNQLP